MKAWKDCTFDELGCMDRDHADIGDWSIMVDAQYVWLTDQTSGESPKEAVGIPRDVFNRLLDEYLRLRELKPAKARKP